MLADAINRLIGLIYDAALSDVLWPDVLNHIIQSINSQSGLLRVQDLHSKDVGMYITNGLDPAFSRQYIDHYVHLDTLIPAFVDQPVGTVGQVRGFMPESFYKGEFFNDFALPQGEEHTVGCILKKSSSQIIVLGLHRSDRGGTYNSDELDLFRLLVPHLQRALLVNQRLTQLTTVSNASCEILHRFPVGIVLVDVAGKPLFVNRQAEAIMASDYGITISNNRIKAAKWSDTQALNKLLFEATRAPLRTGGGLCISNSRLRPSLSVLVTPVGKEQNTGFQLDPPLVAAALIIGTPEQQLDFSIDLLRHLHGLTRAEARLAAALANGHSLEMMADQFSVSMHTIRCQLKSCFRKTGTNRQAELVKLILCAPAVLIDGYSRG